MELTKKFHKFKNCLVEKNTKFFFKIGNYFIYKVVLSKLKQDFLRSKKNIIITFFGNTPNLSSYEQNGSRINNIVCPGTLSYQIQVINMTKKKRAKKGYVNYEINRIL